MNVNDVECANWGIPVPPKPRSGPCCGLSCSNSMSSHWDDLYMYIYKAKAIKKTKNFVFPSNMAETWAASC